MIGTFALFDLVNFFTPAKRIAPAMAMVLFGPWIAPTPAIGIGSAAIVMSLLVSNAFAADERGRLDTLYATLPVSRRSIVVGRYLALGAIYLITAVAATAAAVAAQTAQGGAVDAASLAAANLVCLAAFALALAVQLPFFFSLGFSRARLIAFVPGVVFVGGAAILAQTKVLTVSEIASFLSQDLSALWVLGAVVVVLALGASLAVSLVRYGRRAF